MIKYHLKKRIDIVVEAPLTRTLTSTLDQARVPGYSVLPILEGRGMLNAWSSDGQISDAANMVALLCIVDAAQADDVIDAIFAVIRDRIGFVTMSDVFVLRPERFWVAPMGTLSVYSHETFAMATMHAKERAVARPFSRWLGAAVTVAPGIDTDAFGTFTGEIVRRGTMLDAARAKALAAIEATGLELGLGCEGSFGAHPSLPFIAAGTEVLLCLDRKRGLEIHEMLVTHRTNYQSFACRPGEDIENFLSRASFPSHAVVVTSRAPVVAPKIVKGIISATRLAEAIKQAACASRDGRALVVTDMRAHLNPTRMAVIRGLATRLAQRLATPCPACAAPGFGTADVVRGLPCGWCCEPTRLVIAELLRCGKCEFESRRTVRGAPETADPGQCRYCNP